MPGSPAWEAMTPDAQQHVYADYAAINALPNMTQGLPLGLPHNAVTITVEHGEVKRFAGTRAVNGDTIDGYGVVEADTIEEAIAVAALIPAARLGGRHRMVPRGGRLVRRTHCRRNPIRHRLNVLDPADTGPIDRSIPR